MRLIIILRRFFVSLLFSRTFFKWSIATFLHITRVMLPSRSPEKLRFFLPSAASGSKIAQSASAHAPKVICPQTEAEGVTTNHHSSMSASVHHNLSISSSTFYPRSFFGLGRHHYHRHCLVLILLLGVYEIFLLQFQLPSVSWATNISSPSWCSKEGFCWCTDIVQSPQMFY
jgi:hypothetical protein